MSDQLTPLEVAKRLIGPPAMLEKICGLKPKAHYGWTRPSQKRPAGFIPLLFARKLLRFGAQHDLPVTSDHMVFGASVAEVDALAKNHAAQITLARAFFQQHVMAAE